MIARVYWAIRYLDARIVTYHPFVIRRCLATTCVDLLPRGSTRNARSQQTDEEEAVQHLVEASGNSNLKVQHLVEASVNSKSDTIVKKSNIKPKGDTRPLDKVDPVILKYTNFLNDLRTAENTPEKVYETNFGSIRFDAENIPKIHGQFDETEGPEFEQFLQEGNRKESVNSNLSEDNITHNNEVISANNLNEPFPQMKNLSGSKIVDYVIPNTNARRSQNVQGQENYFDELIFSEAIKEAETSVKSEEESRNPTILKQKSKVKDLNYVDKQYFKEAVENRETIEHPKEFSDLKSSKDIKTDEGILPKSDTNDMHYIDNIFFKDSLDNINIAEKSNLKDNYSEIESEILKSLNAKPEFKFGVLHKNQELTRESIEDPLLIETHIPNEKKVSRKNGTEENIAEIKPKTAFDYVITKRKEERESSFDIGKEGERKNYKKILALVDEKKNHRYTKQEILGLLKRSVIYDKYDIIGLYKPFGLSMHGGTGESHVLTDFLPELAWHLKTDMLHTVHRLDVDTTGVLLLARTAYMASTLKALFKEHQIKKTYWGITKGIPKPLHGIIEIPIGEGQVGDRRRMVLIPDIKGMKVPSKHRQHAVTNFKVLSKANSSALVELQPVTGIKHQLRVHLGFGLGCPILGDHKYSHLEKLAPQRLPGDILTCLKMKQSRVRDLPIFLHSRSILLPEMVEGRNIFIKAKLPAFFNKTLSLLKLNKRKNQVQDVDLERTE